VNWSRDGKKFVYLSMHNNDTQKIKLKELDKGEEKDIFEIKKEDKLLGFSPDGRFILYKAKGEEAIYAWDLSKSKAILVVKGEKTSNHDIFHFKNWIPVP
jgi:Tol biopolymer transport system component